MVLVSQDRELVKGCEKYDVCSIEVDEFYSILQNSLLEDVVQDLTSQHSTIQKFDDVFLDDDIRDVRSKSLDILMEQESMVIPKKEDDLYSQAGSKVKGRAKQLSKKEKLIYAKLKKLS